LGQALSIGLHGPQSLHDSGNPVGARRVLDCDVLGRATHRCQHHGDGNASAILARGAVHQGWKGFRLGKQADQPGNRPWGVLEVIEVMGDDGILGSQDRGG
jgi:hypothetical protein